MDVDVAAVFRVDLPSAPLQCRMSFEVKVQIPNLYIDRNIVKTNMRHTWPLILLRMYSLYHLPHHTPSIACPQVMCSAKKEYICHAHLYLLTISLSLLSYYLFTNICNSYS